MSPSLPPPHMISYVSYVIYYVSISYMILLILWNKLLLDEYTQADQSQISLVQVDLEQIKYTIQPTFLDQIEMQVSR